MPAFSRAIRITDLACLEIVKRVVGSVRVQIESLLSMGVANSPLAGARLRVNSGNFITARPLGVRDGIDLAFTGEVRRVDRQAIEHQLELGAIVLISPIGYSPTGEVFNLSGPELATRVAIELQAAKLIFLDEDTALFDGKGQKIGQLTLEEARRALDAGAVVAAKPAKALLTYAIDACAHGVKRVHLVDRCTDGALLHELYTRDGIGTMINTDPYDSIRQATTDDLPGIVALIEPLERQGLLIRRSREKLEAEIDAFTVVERDGAVIGCAGIHTLDGTGSAELSCFAVAASYQESGIGAALLDAAELAARQKAIGTLFLLTTQAVQWFKERGFTDSSASELPGVRQATYNEARNSRVLRKVLGP